MRGEAADDFEVEHEYMCVDEIDYYLDLAFKEKREIVRRIVEELKGKRFWKVSFDWMFLSFSL